MFVRSEIKSKAKEQIKGNIGILFVCMLVVGVIVGLPSSLSQVIAPINVSNITNIGVTEIVVMIIAVIFVWIITPALQMGIIKIYLGLSNGKKPEVGDVFSGFSIFGKAWWLSFITNFFIMMWSILFFIPGIIKGYSYSMAIYILAENPTMTAREALNESKRITQGAKVNLFVLDLSFIGWAILCGITFGILLIYVIPYMNATYVNAYKAIKERNAQ